MRFTMVSTAWGSFAFVTRGGRLVATYLPQPVRRQREAIRADWPDAIEDPTVLPRFRRQIADYFKGKPVKFSAKLDFADVPSFRRKVLQACHRIPHGKTASYADLARSVGNPSAARAVGGAMANNPLPIVIPCHRVLRTDGSFGGFSSPGGIREKKRLLSLECAEAVCKPGPRSKVRTVRRGTRRAR